MKKIVLAVVILLVGCSHVIKIPPDPPIVQSYYNLQEGMGDNDALITMLGDGKTEPEKFKIQKLSNGIEVAIYKVTDDRVILIFKDNQLAKKMLNPSEIEELDSMYAFKVISLEEYERLNNIYMSRRAERSQRIIAAAQIIAATPPHPIYTPQQQPQRIIIQNTPQSRIIGPTNTHCSPDGFGGVNCTTN